MLCTGLGSSCFPLPSQPVIFELDVTNPVARIPIPVAPDEVLELPEEFSVTLTAFGGSVMVDPAETTVTILDSTSKTKINL